MTVASQASEPEVPHFAAELARRRTRDLMTRFLGYQTKGADIQSIKAPTLADLVAAAYIIGMNDQIEAQL